jgi:glycosyltransferase involved in cell wall biosynthesis
MVTSVAECGDVPTADVVRRGRLGFVPARFGPKIVGGAEIVIRKIAEGLQERGWDVEILTTTALDYFSWDNDMPPGEAVEDGLVVRRFTAVKSTPGVARADIGARLFAGEAVDITSQQAWMNDDVRVPDLFHFLLDHHEDYRALVFGPYLFWPAFACSQVAPDRSLLWTCLHDEPYAYLDLFEPALSGLAGLFLQTSPEHALLHRVNRSPAPHAVVGCGVEVPTSYDIDGFREKYSVNGPYLLYAGRREGAKGWDELLSAFEQAVVRRGLPFSLVTMGAGPVVPPQGLEGRVIDVGFLPDDQRDSAYAGATAYVQPSRYEAFSRTIMESWLAGVPVIGNGASEVVRHHIEHSRAGLVYDNEAELEEALVFMAEAPESARSLGEAGRTYVLDHYRWPEVLDRIERCICAWTAPPARAPNASATGASP